VRDLCREVERDMYDAAILGARDRAGRPTTSIVEWIRARDTRLRIIGCLEEQAVHHSERILLAAAVTQAGADEVIIDELDAYAGLYERICGTACEAKVCERVLQGILLPSSVRLFIEYSVLHVRQSPTVEETAKNIGVSRRTLARQCHDAGLPGPRDLLSWSRLLVAIALLEHTKHPADRIAYRLFSSPSVFRGLLMRYTGLRPRAFREPGGLTLALTKFQDQLVGTVVRPSRHTVPLTASA
jgi:AraC-like DNA-binding protein